MKHKSSLSAMALTEWRKIAVIWTVNIMLLWKMKKHMHYFRNPLCAHFFLISVFSWKQIFLFQHEFDLNFVFSFTFFFKNCKIHFNHKARPWTTRCLKKLHPPIVKFESRTFQNLFNLIQKNVCESLQLYEWGPLIENRKWINTSLISVRVK